MSKHPDHVAILDKRSLALSDALAHLGKGTDLRELLRIIRLPGYTTPAELAFSVLALEAMQFHVDALAKLSPDLLKAGKLVTEGGSL